MEWLFIIIIGIGALIIGGLGIVALISWWWILIPIICALIGGWIGFFFGVGLVVIIGLIISAITSN